MFELPDDDDNFWEDLPLDDITNSKSPKLKNSNQNVPPQCDLRDKGTCHSGGPSFPKCDQITQAKDREDGLSAGSCGYQQGQGLHSTTNLLKSSNINMTVVNTFSTSVENITKNTFHLPPVDTSNHNLMYRDKVRKTDGTDKREMKAGKRLSSESLPDSSKRICLFEGPGIDQSSERSGSETSILQVPQERITNLQTPDTYSWKQVTHGDSGGVNQLVSTGHPTYQVVASARRQTPGVTKDVNTTPVVKKAKRKFPGPAGLLPKLSGNPEGIKEAVTHSLKTSPEQIPLEKEGMILSSQSTDDIFNDDPWRTLMEELGCDGQQLLGNFSIANNLMKARKKQLHRGKVPLLMCVIDSIEWHGADLSVSLKDRSGDVQGTVHRDIVREYESEFQVGSALVLRQISVISPNPRNHYLNITPANIVFIYSKNGDSCKQINTRDTRLSTVLQEVQREECRERHQINPSGALNTPNRNFTQAQRFQNRTPQFGGNSSTPSNPRMNRTPQLGMSSTPRNSQLNRTSQFGGSSSLGTPQIQNRTPHFSGRPRMSGVTPRMSCGRPRMSGVRTPLNEYNPGNWEIDVPQQTQNVRTQGAPAVHQTADRTPFCQTPSKNVHSTLRTPASVSTCTSVPPKAPHSQPEVYTKNQRSGSSCYSQTNLNPPSTGDGCHNVPVLNQTSNVNKSSSCDQKERFQNNDDLISNQQSTPGRRSFKFKPSKTQGQTLSSNSVILNSTSSSSARSHSHHTSVNQNSDNITSISNRGDKPKFDVDSLWGEDLSDDMLSQLSEEF